MAMADNPAPPRKRLRFLREGSRKAGSLLSKTGKKSTSKDCNDAELEIEHNLPILTRIQTPPITCLNTNQSDSTTVQNEADENVQDLRENQNVKAKRRQGFVGVQNLRSEERLVNEPSTLVSEPRMTRSAETATRETAPDTDKTKFTFLASSANGLITSFPPKTAAQAAYAQTSEKLAFLAQNAFRGHHKQNVHLEVSDLESANIPPSVKSLPNSRPSVLSAAHALHGQKPSGAEAQSKIQLKKWEPPYVEDVRLFLRTGTKKPGASAGMILGGPQHHTKFTTRKLPQNHIPSGHDAKLFAEAVGPRTGKRNAAGDNVALSYLEPEQHPVETERRTSRGPKDIPSINSLNIPSQGITRLPPHISTQPPRRPNTLADEASVPEDAFTAPNRLSNAYLGARRMLKRKRPQDTILPPPSFIYQHSGDPNFNIFQNGFLLYPELCLALASHLSVDSLVSLYAISKDFHTIVDQRFTTVILSQATRKAYESSHAFPYKCYKQFCQPDPAGFDRSKLLHPNPILASQGHLRPVPSFHWLKFIMHREKAIQEILAIFAERGCPLPQRCTLTLKRMWFMFDIPDNARRIAYVHSRTLFSDLDLYMSMCFIVKLDMLLNDPRAAEKRDTVREMLFKSIDGFDTIRRVLKGEQWNSPVEMMRAYLRYGMEFSFRNGQVDPLFKDVFGVPIEEIGALRWEYWGLKKEKPVNRPLMYLERPDNLIMREAIRRGFRFDKEIIRCMLYGYVNPLTLESAEPVKYGRRIRDLEHEGEYGVDDVVGGVRALAVNEDNDEKLLELGDTWTGSPYTIVPEDVPVQLKETRSQEKELLASCMKAWKAEVADLE